MSDSGATFDWVFDFALQFLESDKFDAAVMDFVDERCEVFDSDDENKFIYTDIHRDFRDHIESLITSNLGELGITPQMFYESCEKGRHSRDINRAVFERLLSMEDFDTFKRIMVKRNMELQVEALASYDSRNDPGVNSPSPYHHNVTPLKNKPRNGGMKLMPSIDSPLTEAEEKSQIAEAMAASLRNGATSSPIRSTDDSYQLNTALQYSLMEMELIHRQEELERVEFEKAVALSLAIEEDRLKGLREEAKAADAAQASKPRVAVDHAAAKASSSVSDERAADSKGSLSSTGTAGGGSKHSAPSKSAANDDLDDEFGALPTSAPASAPAPSSSSSSSAAAAAAAVSTAAADDDFSAKATSSSSSSPSSSFSSFSSSSQQQQQQPPTKPVKPQKAEAKGSLGSMGRGLGSLAPLPSILGSKPLPPISSGQNLNLEDQPATVLPTLSQIKVMSQELDERKAAAAAAHRQSQESAAVARAKEEELRNRVGLTAEEADARARAMREQRDRLVAMKKQEREKRVQEEEERKREIQTILQDEGDAGADARDFIRRQTGAEAKGGSGEDPELDAAAAAEERRASMRKALARKMKIDLVEAEDAKMAAMQERQFEELESKLRMVEQVRQENKQRERVLRANAASSATAKGKLTEVDF